MYVREVDHVRTLAVLETAAASGSCAELIVTVMPTLQNLMHADEVSYSVVTSTGRVMSAAGFPTSTTALPQALQAWESRPGAHPWVAHISRHVPTASVRLSDLCTAGELRRSDFYQDFYRPRGINYADYEAVSSTGGQTVGLGVSRADRDFDSDEHDLFEHLRRPLSLIWDITARCDSLTSVAPGTFGTSESLTPAERRVSTLVLRGWRTAAIARTLGVSPKAVEQHLTRIYRKARVNSRAEYLAQSIGERLRPESGYGST